MTVSHGNQPLLGYQNLLRDATVDSDDALASFPANQLTDGRTATQAGFATGTGEVIYDLGSEQSIDYAAIARHNLGAESATLTIEHGTSVSGPWSTFLTLSPGSNGPAYKRATSVSKRYIRVTLSGHSGSVYIGDLSVGAELTLPAAMPLSWTRPRFNRQDKMRATRSRVGQLVGLTREEAPRQADITMRVVDPAWFDDNWSALEAAILQYPFYFLHDVDNRPGEVMFCWLRGEVPSPADTLGGKYQEVTIKVEGITE